MITLRYFAFLVAFLTLGLISCEKALLPADPDARPHTVFEALWQDVRDRYSYFEEKQIDWEIIGDTYRHQLDADMSAEILFDVLADMLFHLEDGHVNIRADFDRSRNWDWFQDFPANYNATLIEAHYLGKDYRIIGPMRTQILDDEILYLDYRSFAEGVTNGNIDALLHRTRSAKGVIIDVRHNGGGSLHNALRLASAFCENTTTYARERIKTGPGRDQFSAWYDLQIAAFEGEPYTGKVAVLTNRRTYSAANFFAQMARSLPHARLFGDQTGGGGGIPVFGELPNGWTYRFSASQAVSPEGEHLEFGVPVHDQVALTPADEQAGTDTIIEAAIAWINQ